MIREFTQALRAWYRRRFRGFVAGPRTSGGQGTSWQQHPHGEVGFTCRCGRVMAFTINDFQVREREHVADCSSSGSKTCGCPITDARFVKICTQCHLGHWKNALGLGDIPR